jgi:hypothetical protein
MRTTMILSGLVSLFLAADHPRLVAQAAPAAPPVPVGAQVRVASPVYSGIGTVVRVDQDSLQLVIEGLETPISIPAASVTRLERRRPATAGERARRGAMWGVGILGGLGMLMYATADLREGDPTFTEWALLSTGSGALWGGVVGLVIPQSRWDWVPLGAKVDITPAGREGLALTVAIPF